MYVLVYCAATALISLFLVYGFEDIGYTLNAY